MTDLRLDARQLADPTLPRVSLPTSRRTHAAIQLDPPQRREQPQQVLLVPGYTGSKEDFAPIVRAISEAGYRVTAIDQRGQFETPGAEQGESESEASYVPDALAQDVIAVAEQLQADPEHGPVHLLGHSFGGLVCRAAVIAAPEVFASFVLMDTGPAAVAGDRRERMALLRPVLVEHGLEVVYQGMKMLDANDPDYVPPPADLEEFEHRRFISGSPTMLLGMGEALIAEPDRCEQLRASKVTMMLLHGVDEDVWPPDVQAEYAERLGVEPVVIANAAHSPAADNPHETAEALVRFWASVGERR